MMIVSCLSMLTLILIPKTKHVFTFRWPTSSRPWWSCRSQPPSTPPTPAGQPLTWTVALAMFVMVRSADCWPIMIKTTNTADTILRIVDTVSVASKPLPRKPAFNETMIYHDDCITIIMIYHDDGNTEYIMMVMMTKWQVNPLEVFWPSHSQGRERVGAEPVGEPARALTFSKVWNWNNFVTNTRYARAYWA